MKKLVKNNFKSIQAYNFGERSGLGERGLLLQAELLRQTFVFRQTWRIKDFSQRLSNEEPQSDGTCTN
jgi:hypothetical protein